MQIFRPLTLLLSLLLLNPGFVCAEPVRMKDLGRLQGWRDNPLIGTGIVTGLNGTGDSPSNRAARQALANALAQFNLTVPQEQIQSRNVALVMVSANVPNFARVGDSLDVTVTSTGDARSLVGGSLLITPLRGTDGRNYALAQGSLTVGGYRYDANGNAVQKNHATTASIPNGAVVELSPRPAGAHSQEATAIFVLHEPDYTTAQRLADAINQRHGQAIALARDASGIEIQLPPSAQHNSVAFLATLESLTIEPDRRARVVINERTGTLVAGGDVKISKVAISHGDLRISVVTQNTASQPLNVIQSGQGDGIRSLVVSNTRLDVQEGNPTSGPSQFVSAERTVAELVQALTKLKISTRDIISILRAVKTAGALHAELVVQ